MAKKTTPESEIVKKLTASELVLLESLRHKPECHTAYKNYADARTKLKKAQGDCAKCKVRTAIMEKAASR